jgi:hypothetical protein
MNHAHHHDHTAPHTAAAGSASLTMTAFRATLHCLWGCHAHHAT